MSFDNLPPFDYQEVLSGSDSTNARFQALIGSIVTLTKVINGSGVPTFEAQQHQQYFDTSTNKYYRNVDGGTTWVALN